MSSSPIGVYCSAARELPEQLVDLLCAPERHEEDSKTERDVIRAAIAWICCMNAKRHVCLLVCKASPCLVHAIGHARGKCVHAQQQLLLLLLLCPAPLGPVGWVGALGEQTDNK